MMTGYDQHLFVVGLLETAMKADNPEGAAAAVRADLEVLDRTDLLAIATGLAVLPTKQALDPGLVQLMWRALERHRLRVMWSGS